MLEIRPCTSRADEQASLDAYNAVWPWDALTLEEVDDEKRAAAAWFDALAVVDGDVAGSGFAAVRGHRPTVAFTIVTVFPEHRRRGAGHALYRAISHWARPQAIEALDTIVPEDDPDSIAFAEGRGFVEVERNGRLVLELNGVEPAPPRPLPGVVLTTLAERPELARGIYEVDCQAHEDVPGRGRRQHEPFEHWLAHSLARGGGRPDAVFVAVEGDEVVGYAKLRFTEAQPDVAFHAMTGVRRDRRGRGIAGALKRAQVRWAKQHGFVRLQAENEVRNEPIRRINVGLGYVPAPGEVVMRGPLAP